MSLLKLMPKYLCLLYTFYCLFVVYFSSLGIELIVVVQVFLFRNESK